MSEEKNQIEVSYFAVNEKIYSLKKKITCSFLIQQ